MGWSMCFFLYPQGRTRRLQRRALSRLYSLCSSCIQVQRLAHHAHRVLVQPVQVSLIAQPWRRTRTWSLLREHFYTTLVKKSQQPNGASELRRTPQPGVKIRSSDGLLRGLG
jgi:hypothetical protein